MAPAAGLCCATVRRRIGAQMRRTACRHGLTCLVAEAFRRRDSTGEVVGTLGFSYRNGNGAGISADPTLTGGGPPKGCLSPGVSPIRSGPEGPVPYWICRPALAPVPDQGFRSAKPEGFVPYLPLCPRPIASPGASNGPFDTGVSPIPRHQVLRPAFPDSGVSGLQRSGWVALFEKIAGPSFTLPRHCRHRVDCVPPSCIRAGRRSFVERALRFRCSEDAATHRFGQVAAGSTYPLSAQSPVDKGG